MAELQQVRKVPQKAVRAALNRMRDAAVEKLHAELRESEERYRALFDLGPVAVCSIDTSGVIQNFNRRAVELWGREPALGDTDERFCGSYKLFRPDGSFMPHQDCPMAQVVSGKIPAVDDAEVLIERPDHSRITVVVNVRPLKNQRGDITGAINCFYDITERKQTEEAKAKLAAIVEYSDDAIISKDLNSVITSWNAGAERLFGYTAQDAIGRSIRMLIPPDRLAEEAMILERLKRAEPVEHFETVRLRKDGAALQISLTISPIKNSRGQVIGASKIARDITERRQAEQQLRESEAETNRARDYAEATLRTSPVPLLVLEKDLRVKTANEAFYHTFQVEQAMTEGCLVYELGNGQWNIPKLRELLEDILPHHTVFTHFEVTHDFETIGRRTMLLNARRMENEASTPERIVLVIEDITERKQAEEALALAQAQLSNHATHLEALVAERTARLQDTIAELERFSYAITHDMRAPLRAMQGFGSMLLEDSSNSLSPAGADCLKRIIDAARRMDALIRDSLQYAKVVREQPPLAPVEPGPILQSILRSYPSLQPPRVEIQVVEPLPAVIAAETGLAQCFSNLLINAVKFVHPGITPKIRIWAEARRPSSPTVRFWFEDNGIGIPPEYHARIFDMFQQLDKSYEGTGIGLALVRKTVKRMGGNVGVESELGKGSRFWLELASASHA